MVDVIKEMSKGEWKADSSTGYNIEMYVRNGDNMTLLGDVHDDFSRESEANAALIAEAGNVTQETGLAPRELKALADELVEAGRWLANLNGGVGKRGGEPESGEWESAWKDMQSALDRYEAARNSSEGKT